MKTRAVIPSTAAEAPVRDSLARLLRALDQAVEEVRTRDADYFERHALRAALREVPLHTPASAASAILASRGAPQGSCRITAFAEIRGSEIAGPVSDAYGVELVFAAEPSISGSWASTPKKTRGAWPGPRSHRGSCTIGSNASACRQ
jgi:hypothetical protein